MTIMEFDEYLIELVRSHSDLYNMTDRRYSDSVWKETLWKEIGEEVGRPGPECKRRWVSLRDQFRKCVIKKTKSGQAAILKKPWKYEDIMAFLRPYMLEREPVSNIIVDICSEDESNSEVSSPIPDIENNSDLSPDVPSRQSPAPGDGGVLIVEQRLTADWTAAAVAALVELTSSKLATL
ncbi:transcription factor Adf-1-like [Schistocerca piceifrons]|uniref:transcription factor Adf-1-like n=1 Tax=Schistocerca piceifrons TaxID=274613 RepID=UPI001F5E4DD9|nr:transcription factor Adf-1-like [Schistocerca piceifrons]